MKGFVQILWVSVFFLVHSCDTKTKTTSSEYTSLQWGEYLYYYKKMDSAFLMFSRAANDAKTDLDKATAYNYMGTMQRSAGDLYAAQESLTSALKTLDRNNPDHLDLITFVYNELGNTSIDLKRYDEAVNLYDSALRITNEKTYIPEILNGKATALQKEKLYNNAIAIYDSIIQLAPDNKTLVARAISNRARTKWLRDSSYPALNEYRQALRIRLDSSDNAGLNASYAHLSDYYVSNNTDSALYYAEMMHRQAINNNSPDDILEAKDKLIRLNKSAAAKEQLYNDFKRLNDSLQLSRDTTRSRFALIRYDVQKSKADNLVLQRHITNQQILMAAIGVAALMLIIGLLVWFSRRRQKLKQEAELEIRNSKIATSQKVHDVVANGLYRIMNELEHVESIDKEPLLNNIEQLYERSRDISYEDPVVSHPKNDSQFHDLITSYAKNGRRVIGIGNQQPFWQNITAAQKEQLYLVMSELMVNMDKHSKARSVVVQFKVDGRHAYIHYKDDGIGFPSDHNFGNGLKNTVSRIKRLNGEVNFGKNGDSGVSIEISFPLETNVT
ncbi:MAG: ATP-binding protein [Chitinophagaceae bacterium]|nr:MAG: ATP-binding protein [Chitinophagaceae bacterium]